MSAGWSQERNGPLAAWVSNYAVKALNGQPCTVQRMKGHPEKELIDYTSPFFLCFYSSYLVKVLEKAEYIINSNTSCMFNENNRMTPQELTANFLSAKFDTYPYWFPAKNNFFAFIKTTKIEK